MVPNPTLKELAAMTNVSISTVSRALSSPEKVKFSTRKKIETALEDYQNKARERKSNLIGLIIPDMLNQFFPLIISGADSAAFASGVTLITLCSDNSREREATCIKKLLDMNVDGIIIISSDTHSPLIEEIIKEKIVPIVFLDRNPGIEDINLITTDNFEGMYQGTRYLLTLGHKRIMYLGGREGTSTNTERLNGCVAALNEENLRLAELAYGNYDFHTSYTLIKDMIKTERISFTAIVAANDVMALAAEKALSECSIKIPEDISIIGYDDIPSASYSNLTTVKQPFMEMGKTAVFTLLSSMKEPFKKKKAMVLNSNIIFRGSCGICKESIHAS